MAHLRMLGFLGPQTGIEMARTIHKEFGRNLCASWSGGGGPAGVDPFDKKWNQWAQGRKATSFDVDEQEKMVQKGIEGLPRTIFARVLEDTSRDHHKQIMSEAGSAIFLQMIRWLLQMQMEVFANVLGEAPRAAANQLTGGDETTKESGEATEAHGEHEEAPGGGMNGGERAQSTTRTRMLHHDLHTQCPDTDDVQGQETKQFFHELPDTDRSLWE